MPDSLDHRHWMSEALALAARAAAANEVPVGAVIVHHPFGTEGGGGEPRVIGVGFNERELGCDPSAHAEIVAMRQAGRALGHWRLVDCTMYVTLEPCPMCAGAAVQARLSRLVFGCCDPKGGAVETLYQLCNDPRMNHQVEVIGGVMAEEAAALLKGFFAQRRREKPEAASQ